MFLSVVLVAGAGFAYLIYKYPQYAQAAVAIDTTTTGSETTGLSVGNTFNSNSFSTSGPNELVLAVIQLDSSSDGNVTLTVSNLSGAGLTWHLAERENATAGGAEIWYSLATSALSSQTLTGTLGCTGANCSASEAAVISVVSFSGTATNGVNGAGAIGAVNGCNSTLGAPSCSLTTTRNNSFVLGSLYNYTNGTAPTVPGGAAHTCGAGTSQTCFSGVVGAAGSYYWGQKQNATTPSSGTSVTINDTAPSVEYEEAIVEILPPSSKTGNFVLQGGKARQVGGKVEIK